MLWSEVATRDLEDLVAYVARESILDAERRLERFVDTAARLDSLPMRGRVVPELARFGMPTWRELIVRPYRLIHRVADDTVTVLAFVDGRRDIEDLLLERLIRS